MIELVLLGNDNYFFSFLLVFNVMSSLIFSHFLFFKKIQKNQNFMIGQISTNNKNVEEKFQPKFSSEE
jgi:hypothetical protein